MNESDSIENEDNIDDTGWTLTSYFQETKINKIDNDSNS